MQRVSLDTYSHRVATCKGCEHRKDRPGGLFGCKKWNCPCPVIGKAWLQSTTCPENKW